MCLFLLLLICLLAVVPSFPRPSLPNTLTQSTILTLPDLMTSAADPSAADPSNFASLLPNLINLTSPFANTTQTQTTTTTTAATIPEIQIHLAEIPELINEEDNIHPVAPSSPSTGAISSPSVAEAAEESQEEEKGPEKFDPEADVPPGYKLDDFEARENADDAILMGELDIAYGALEGTGYLFESIGFGLLVGSIAVPEVFEPIGASFLTSANALLASGYFVLAYRGKVEVRVATRAQTALIRHQAIDYQSWMIEQEWKATHPENDEPTGTARSEGSSESSSSSSSTDAFAGGQSEFSAESAGSFTSQSIRSLNTSSLYGIWSASSRSSTSYQLYQFKLTPISLSIVTQTEGTNQTTTIQRKTYTGNIKIVQQHIGEALKQVKITVPNNNNKTLQYTSQYSVDTIGGQQMLIDRTNVRVYRKIANVTAS